jgi:hypothetical protein
MSLLKKIPPQIVDIILSFDGRIVNRRGVYIDRLSIQDIRYEILKSIPLKEFENNAGIVDLVINKNKSFILYYNIFEQKIKIRLLLIEFYEKNNKTNNNRHITYHDYYLL